MFRFLWHYIVFHYSNYTCQLIREKNSKLTRIKKIKHTCSFYHSNNKSSSKWKETSFKSFFLTLTTSGRKFGFGNKKFKKLTQKENKEIRRNLSLTHWHEGMWWELPFWVKFGRKIIHWVIGFFLIFIG